MPALPSERASERFSSLSVFQCWHNAGIGGWRKFPSSFPLFPKIRKKKCWRCVFFQIAHIFQMLALRV